MVSLECFNDVQISCHTVVLLCKLFRDKFPGLPLPFHLLGSDCSSLEFTEESLRLGDTHAKQQTIWGKLHPRSTEEAEPDLANFSGLEGDEDIICCLLIGLTQAQDLLTQLNMAPHTSVRDQSWWRAPWVLERDFWNNKRNDVVDSSQVDDWDAETVPVEDTPLSEFWLLPNEEDVTDENTESDGVNDLHVLENETRHVMAKYLDQALSGSVFSESPRVDPMVSFDGHQIYKATLVSQLNGNPMLSKDRLTRIKQSVYFNGVKPKPREPGIPSCIMDIGSDCAVLFSSVQAQKRTRSRKRRGPETTTKEVWIGRVQKIRRKYNGKWGKTRVEIDLLDRPVGEGAGERNICQVLFKWYTPV
ncbi:hypothetical protein R1sor_019947 [Riccia sorocarpa]|uniref:Uncharacterized protein n=1 Tax=Riccia sorocarpa TaxID=122646 RepID=A0ABD3IDX9_9MARC